MNKCVGVNLRECFQQTFKNGNYCAACLIHILQIELSELNKVFLSEERFNELEKAENKLNALEVAGVDNWEGYDDAMEDMSDE